MLKIYSASAGSGKTHLLTESYLKLLLLNDTDFRRILAVTFTNKATDEMKSRIVEELHRIIVAPETSLFLKDAGAGSVERCQQRAKQALPAILHDYSSFTVSTIDRFFQQVLRAFTREVGVNEGYTLELDTEKSLEIIIDRMYASLGAKENIDLLHWLIDFSENKLEEGASWDVKRDLFSLSEELFKETFRLNQASIRTEIEDKEKLRNFRTELKTIQHNFREKLKKIGKRALGVMDTNGLVYSQFKGASMSQFKRFHAFAQGEVCDLTKTFIELHNNLETWTTQKTGHQTTVAIASAYHSGLNRCITDVLNLYDDDRILYNTAVEIDRNFFRLALLGDISRHLSAYTEEKNLLFIQDTTELLNKIIEKADAPFIYEKTGTRIDHYMIDEFQDTSNMQWQNFLPLLKESLASGKNNLIVGDVKQSIYRFRNSNWQLLTQIEEFFDRSRCERHTLQKNWRSKEGIVAFNNRLFGWIKEQTGNKNEKELFDAVAEAYADVQQEVAPNKKDTGGYIRLSFIEDTKEEKWHEKVKERLPRDLEQLQAQGVSLGDIGILVRKNAEAKEIARLLLDYRQEHPESPYRFDIVSDEALEVSSSKAVQLLLAALGYIANPFSDTVRFRLLLLHEQLSWQVSGLSDKKFMLFSDGINDDPFLAALRRTPGNSLYELTENLVSRFSGIFGENDVIFIQSFLDIILEFSSRDSQELSLFLEWWENSGIKRKISLPDTQDAIRIMTVHKSKGLEFKHVILPFCEWKTNTDSSKGDILWCSSSAVPFNEFTFLPVKYGKKLAETLFEKEYIEERKLVFIDNLNAFYVALTRAKEQMFIYTPLPKTGATTFSSVSAFLYGCFGREVSPDSSEVCFGRPVLATPAATGGEKECKESPTLCYAGKGNRLLLRLKRTFSYEQQDDKRGFGIFMHRILSRIKDKNDLENVVSELVDTGDLLPQNASELLALLKQKIAHPLAKAWFEPGREVLSEHPILSAAGIKIPDRIVFDSAAGEVEVIDYKLGDKEEERYLRQVKTYCGLLEQMGYKQPKGYLWYVSLDKVVKI